MITAQNISDALTKNFDKIRNELEPSDWSRFYSELVPLRYNFISIADRNALEVAADSVWQVCRRYPFISDLIREYSTEHEKKHQAGGAGRKDEEPILDILNRFQSLFDHLEEVERGGRSAPGYDVAYPAVDSNDIEATLSRRGNDIPK